MGLRVQGDKPQVWCYFRPASQPQAISTLAKREKNLWLGTVFGTKCSKRGGDILCACRPGWSSGFQTRCGRIRHHAPSRLPAGLRGAFLLHFGNLKNVVFRKSVRIVSKESVRQTSSAISSRDRALRLKLGWWIALIKA